MMREAALPWRSAKSRATARPLRGRIHSYLRAVPALLAGLRNPWSLLPLTVARGKSRPRQLILADGTRYMARDLADMWVIKETALDRLYQRYSAPIQDGWAVLDIGAGLGDFAIFAARRAPRGCVHAYEPDPSSAELLRCNVALNALDNVAVYQAAVWDRSGILALDTSSGIPARYKPFAADAETCIIVPAVSLAEALERLLALSPSGACDLLKIDAEGAEFAILLGSAPDCLARVQRIILEYHDFLTAHHHRELVRYLSGQGWTVRTHPNPTWPGLGFLYAERLSDD